MKSWGTIAAVAFALWATGIKAQTETTLKDLGTVLSEQKNLTTFYGLIQVRSFSAVARRGDGK